MIDYWMLTAAWMATVLLAVWHNHRVGYRKGYVHGVIDAVDDLIKETRITGVVTDKDKDTERPASRDEMFQYLVEKMVNKRFE